MSFLRGFLSSPTEEEKQSGGVEAIEKLCDRLETATLLDDRRDAIRALRALSKSFQVEVGTHAMDMLIRVITDDSSDVEITEMVIETLNNVMSSKGDNPPETDLGVQFTEMFVKSETNISLLLSLIEEYEFHVRWPTVKLLILLLKNKSKELQDRVLESPMGISKLMDLLSDSREVIRNDGLLLMIKLTKNNPAIQKIVAFENAFERLLMIVSVEGYSDGGIIVEDCLSLLLNLLRNNLSNQNFFRETSNIQRIAPFFEMDQNEEEGERDAVWNVQKQTNILLMLDILQVLISPTNNPQSVTSCQKVMYTRGIYMQLMDLLLFPNLPTDIFARMLLTIGDIIRGNEIIQQFMDELELADRPAIVLILMFMVNEKQPFKVRLAALYCVQCFLFRNEKGQGSIVYTLLPNTEDVPTSVTSGQLLCAGLFSNDDVAHWLCSVLLSHCLYNNPTQRDNMLLVQLELTPGNPPVHLISQVFQMLVTEESQRTRFGTLMLLVQWLEECPAASATLLQDDSFVPYILEMIDSNGSEDDSLLSSLCTLLLGLCLKFNDNSCEKYNKATLLHLVTHRVGVDNFNEILESACVKPYFTQASKSPHPTAASPNDLALDFCFTKFYKKQQGILAKTLEGEEEAETENTIESHDLIVNSYKELIKEQDEEIQKLKEQLATGSNQQAAVSTTDVEQLQQYSRDQEQYYQQYISQLQTWYNDQMKQEHDTKTSLETRFEELRQAKEHQDKYAEQLAAEMEELKQTNAELLARTDPVSAVPVTAAPQLSCSTPECIEIQHQEQQNDELAALRISLNAALAEGETTRDALVDLNMHHAALQRALTESESESSSLRGTVAHLEGEVDRLSGLLAESESERDRLQSEIKERVEEAGKRHHEEVQELQREQQVHEEGHSEHEVHTEQEEQSEQGVTEVSQELEILRQKFKELEVVHAATQHQLTSSQDSYTSLQEEAQLLTSTNEQLTQQIKSLQEEAATTQDTPQAVQDTAQAVAPQAVTPQTTQYLYDYSQWFTPITADDGVTYYQSTDGHVYTLEQYQYTIEQYEQYYRAQLAEQNQPPESNTATEQQQDRAEQQQDRAEQQERTAREISDLQERLQAEICAHHDEVELLKSQIDSLRREMEILKTSCTGEKKSLSKTPVTQHNIESVPKPCERSEMKTLEIVDVGPNHSPTPDMMSSSSDNAELALLQEKYESLNTEQEDLLVLLAHQDKQLASLKARLRSLGDSVVTSESDDDFADLMSSCEDLPKTSQLTGDGRLAVTSDES